MVTRMTTWLFISISILLWIHSVSGQWGGKKKEVCSKPELSNGSIKIRSSGRVIRYNCLKGYFAVGETIATCVRGKWSSEPPVCAARGCDDLSPPESGRFVKGFAGAVLLAECNPGYVLYGSRMIFCDGAVWNDTTPTCKASNTRASLSCTFETENLCGWIQDPLHNFDWKRQNMETPSRTVDTGPSFDHTLGPGKEGYYLYIESSSPRVENDTARLYSPVYGPEMTKGGCFIFWYHMFGSGTGSLLVYVKPESKTLKEIEPGFRKSGNQGNFWHQGYVPLPDIEENFQIIIEGIRGSSYASDIAIDDVLLAQGNQCLNAANQTAEIPGVAPTGETATPQVQNSSCFSRCGTGGSPTICSCNMECLLNASCCLDYIEFCLTGHSAVPTAGSVTTSVTTPLISRSTEGPDQDKSKQEFSTKTTLEATTTFPRTSSTTTSTSLKITSSTSTTTVPMTTSMPTTISTSSQGPVTLLTTEASTGRSMATRITPSLGTTQTWTNKSSQTTAAEVDPQSFSTTEAYKSSSVSSHPTTRTTTRSMASTDNGPRSTTRTPASTTLAVIDVTRSSRVTNQVRPSPTTSASVTFSTSRSTVDSGDQSRVSSTFFTTTWTTLDAALPSMDGPSRINSEQVKSDEMKASVNVVVIGVVGGLIGMVALLTLVVISVIRLRNKKPLRVKKQERLPEDSDVRYLRPEDDVQLDLTEATPSQFSNFEQL